MKRKILILLLSVFMLFSLTGCFKKSPLTTDSFITNSTSSNFTTQDVTSDFSNEPSIIKATLALNSKGYQIEFYELSSDSAAKDMFITNKTNFQSLNSSKYTESEANVGNYNTYSLSTESEYMYLSRVDKTFLYLKVDISNKDEVKEFIDKLGY